jgi:hypothetical protein
MSFNSRKTFEIIQFKKKDQILVKHVMTEEIDIYSTRKKSFLPSDNALKKGLPFMARDQPINYFLSLVLWIFSNSSLTLTLPQWMHFLTLFFVYD